MTISEQLIDVTFGEVELVCWHRAHIFYKTTGISRTNSARHPSVKLLNRPGQSCISHTRTQTHKNTHIQIHTHAHTYASTQTHTRTHAHTHTHTHTLNTHTKHTEPELQIKFGSSEFSLPRDHHAACFLRLDLLQVQGSTRVHIKTQSTLCQSGPEPHAQTLLHNTFRCLESMTN